MVTTLHLAHCTEITVTDRFPFGKQAPHSIQGMFVFELPGVAVELNVKYKLCSGNMQVYAKSWAGR